MESTSFMIIFIYESAFLLNTIITFGYLCISVISTGLATQEFGDTNVPSHAGISNFRRNFTDRCQGCEVRTCCRYISRTVLCCTALYCTELYCTVLHCTAMYCTVLYCTVLLCTVLYCTVLYCDFYMVYVYNNLSLLLHSFVLF